MQYGLTDEQEMIVDTVRSFVEKRDLPARGRGRAHRRGAPPSWRDEIRRKTLELGFYACNFPEEVGGAGLGHLDFALVERELGRGSMALTHFFGRPQNILMACEGEQRERYLLPAVRGERMDALAMTEPDAGSDVRGMKCTARREGGDWVVNGTKHFISGADHADFVIVFIATGEDETPKGPKKRITAFLVDRGTPGFTIRDGYKSVSHRGYKNMILDFDDCRLPDAQVLGEVDGGFAVMNDLALRHAHHRGDDERWAARGGCSTMRWTMPRARAVRPEDRQVPGRQLPDRRHDHRDRRRRLADAGRRWRLDQGPARQPRDRLGQALRLGDAGAGDRCGAADPWRHGADGRLPHRAVLARCAGRTDLGRHQRDPAPHHQRDLLRALGPILGPNCYGFVNALDRAALWPDQHGLVPVTRGVAILTQSSNIAINLTMQRRALPIATVIACGNAAQTTQPEIAAALLDDPRITALGLHVEGFGDLRAWEALAKAARARDLPVVVLKLGASDAARQATVSHTGALAGEAAGAAALLARLGFAQVHDLPAFVETLKLYHAVGRLPGNRIAAISCSGGEASLVADMAVGRDLAFAPLTGCQVETLRATLGPMVALANPLDYHTYIWRDAAAMARAWGAMGAGGAAITLSIVDYPTTDASDWACATEAALAVRAETGRPFAVAATLPELMPDEVAARFLDGGVVPFHGLREALAAIEAAARPLAPEADPLVLPGPAAAAVLLDEATAKAALAGHGMEVPRGVVAEADLGVAAASLRGPLALKALGLAHKSEAGALRLGLSADAIWTPLPGRCRRDGS
jgi:alkylation response protein AidB-like acyl-CoA dehydrogenase